MNLLRAKRSTRQQQCPRPQGSSTLGKHLSDAHQVPTGDNCSGSTPCQTHTHTHTRARARARASLFLSCQSRSFMRYVTNTFSTKQPTLKGTQPRFATPPPPPCSTKPNSHPIQVRFCHGAVCTDKRDDFQVSGRK